MSWRSSSRACWISPAPYRPVARVVRQRLRLPRVRSTGRVILVLVLVFTLTSTCGA
ncbi:hypothetical protein [Pseudomonas sp. FEN]|nr:hypothetical protein [Pseudomonas sp. FEN]